MSKALRIGDFRRSPMGGRLVTRLKLVVDDNLVSPSCPAVAGIYVGGMWAPVLVTSPPFAAVASETN